MKLNTSVFALAMGAFGIGVTEFAPMGMLPLIANDLHISIPTAGVLISIYALGVMIGAPLMTLLTRRVPRRTLLIGLAAIFTVGNLLSAVSSSYGILLVARLITSLNHGAFFGIGAVVAASLVPAHRQASAVSAMFMGLTIANVVGVPLAAWTGEVLGWRAAFWGISGIGIFTMAALWVTLPVIPAHAGSNVLIELKILLHRPVWIALGLTVLSSSAMFTVFTYIVPILRIETGASTSFVTAMLVTYGIGLTVGNWIGGRFTDRYPNQTLIISLAALSGTLVLFALFMPYIVPTTILVFLWGVTSFSLMPPLQMRVMAAAESAPNLASSVNIGAFNLGNAVGAALGGFIIAAGLHYPAVVVAGAVTAGLGLVAALLLHRKSDRTRLSHGDETTL
ncbi:MFS transporter [Serratia ficaria]|uniref:Inner membrane transport protein ydhP n=1 Tax=Serratia ficaria TaxID=61651 RepID=A0A240AMV9_SERFI|nr:MFS transporter [Serratia ficaria]REF42020.1 DHA1 family inner membrane transport protein [Serratia ficaria]CAI0940099.1 Inner membrane transport protein ydhP [Serratia ficaria]CAI0956132.1 Inner membrane transport protein ydhP [Serratia ficaria]CAI1040749.1 Inner membrane transport protein ydhP [Serratia ficaria]CAI2063316.1 Inner membrane transport protein ydhP [Serratia ficaria]